MAAHNDVLFSMAGQQSPESVAPDGRVISHAFEQNDGPVVPLVWQHGHDNATTFSGTLSSRRSLEGVYAYGFFNGSQQNTLRELIELMAMLLPCRLREQPCRRGNVVRHGKHCRSVSRAKGANQGD